MPRRRSIRQFHLSTQAPFLPGHAISASHAAAVETTRSLLPSVALSPGGRQPLTSHRSAETSLRPQCYIWTAEPIARYFSASCPLSSTCLAHFIAAVPRSADCFRRLPTSSRRTPGSNPRSADFTSQATRIPSFSHSAQPPRRQPSRWRPNPLSRLQLGNDDGALQLQSSRRTSTSTYQTLQTHATASGPPVASRAARWAKPYPPYLARQVLRCRGHRRPARAGGRVRA